MRKLLTILSVIIALPAMSQFTLVPPSDTFQTDHVDAKFEYYYDIVNEASTGTATIRWRLNPDFSAVPSWDDQICEGIELCFPTSVRTHDFELDAGDTMGIIHYINAKVDTGMGYSNVCFHDITDSANTYTCLTLSGRGLYSITGVEEQKVASELSQNSPNPFKEETIINFQLQSSEGRVSIHDLTGKLVQEIPVSGGSTTLRVSGLNPGLYFYSLWDNNQLVATKRMQVIH